jgi:hypothetical protein
MRLLITLVAILFLSSQQAHAEEDPNYLYSLSFQGGMTMTRYAKPEFAEIMRATRPDGVSINWSYGSDSEAAQSVAKQEIEMINQAVAHVLKSHAGAVLALSSIRGNKQGVWALYTSDGPSLHAALEASLKGKTQVPIRFRVGKDPEWKAFTGFLARLRDEK